jgi:rhomboid protease GluP
MSILQEAKKAPVTTAIFTVNVAVFAWMYLHGVDPLDPDVFDLLHYGADSGPKVWDGEWWRLIASMFLHAGIIHLFFNMWSLRVVGPIVEGMFGSATYFVIYMLAGLGGSVASCMWNPMGTSVGASGAIFGLLGAIIAFFLTHRRSMPAEVFRSYMQRIGLLVAINLFLGFSIPRVDNSAHVGGLVTGFVCGFAAYLPAGTRPVLNARRIVRLGLLGLVLAGAAYLVPWRVSRFWTSHHYPGRPTDIYERR